MRRSLPWETGGHAGCSKGWTAAGWRVGWVERAAGKIHVGGSDRPSTSVNQSRHLGRSSSRRSHAFVWPPPFVRGASPSLAARSLDGKSPAREISLPPQPPRPGVESRPRPRSSRPILRFRPYPGLACTSKDRRGGGSSSVREGERRDEGGKKGGEGQQWRVRVSERSMMASAGDMR